ncbi:helix-turn-helix domain-containing protein [Pseudescherichia vulneris]
MDEKSRQCIENLCNLLVPYAKKITDREMSSGRVCLTHTSGNPSLLLFTSGEVEVYRNEDDLLLASARAPFIFGLNAALSQHAHVYLRPRPDCIMYRVEYDVALNAIQKHGGVVAVSTLIRIQSLVTLSLYQNNVILLNKNAYEIVKKMLFDISELDAKARITINVCNYITLRTGLTRSCVQAQLKNFRNAGYIKMHRGKLIALMSAIPDYWRS